MKFPSSLLGSVLLSSPLISAHEHPENNKAKIVTRQAPTSPPSASYTAPTELIDKALNSTNHFREQHNAAPLAWNNSLADAAASWASNCEWRHSNGPTGENLAVGYTDVVGAIDTWGNERDMYDFNAPTGFTKETGHFSQLVWKETTSMGCAAVDCTNKNSLQGYMLVCEYYPPGNVLGQNNEYFKANVESQVRAATPAASASTFLLSSTSPLNSPSQVTPLRTVTSTLQLNLASNIKPSPELTAITQVVPIPLEPSTLQVKTASAMASTASVTPSTQVIPISPELRLAQVNASTNMTPTSQVNHSWQATPASPASSTIQVISTTSAATSMSQVTWTSQVIPIPAKSSTTQVNTSSNMISTPVVTMTSQIESTLQSSTSSDVTSIFNSTSPAPITSTIASTTQSTPTAELRLASLVPLSAPSATNSSSTPEIAILSPGLSPIPQASTISAASTPSSSPISETGTASNSTTTQVITVSTPLAFQGAADKPEARSRHHWTIGVVIAAFAFARGLA